MSQQPSLRPADVAVALRLAGEPGEGYEALSGALAISLGAAHNSVGRLEQAGLVVPESRDVDRRSLLEFLVHGARFAFYPVVGPEGRGVPTAHAAPPLSDDIVGDTAFVWPSARGSARGTTLTPLYAGAPETVETAPEVYRALALVDALRVGRVRERRLAREHLERLLSVSLAGDESP
jgi:hypothetical protein